MMTEREKARMCIRGGFGCLALILAGGIGALLGKLFFEWVARRQFTFHRGFSGFLESPWASSLSGDCFLPCACSWRT